MPGGCRQARARTAAGAALALLAGVLTLTASSPAQAAAGPLPGPVPNLTLSGPLAEPTLTWDAADGKGAPVIAYNLNFDNVTYFSDYDTVTRSIFAASGLAYSDHRLAPGTHKVLISAVTAYGEGPANEVDWTVPETNDIGYPDAPPSASVSTDSEGHTHIDWTTPANDGGSPILGYELQDYITFHHVDGPATTYDVTYDTPGPQWVTLRAINAKGESDPPTQVHVTIPEPTVPSAVKNLTSHDGLAPSVTWAAPDSDGGSSITGYRVRVDGGSWVSAGTATTYDLSATDAPQQHKVEVEAVNANGDGMDASVLSIHDTPNIPNTPQITGAGNLGEITWSAADGLGTPISSYTLTVDGTTTFTAPGDATSMKLSAVPEGQHTVTIHATNAVGTGGESASWPWLQMVKPSADRNVQIYSDGVGDHWVAWDPPADNGGDTGVGTRILIDGVEQSWWPTRAALEPYETFNLVAMSPGPHTIAVVSTNIAGDGPAVTLTTDSSQWPLPPASVTVTPGGLVRWSAGSGNGHPITGYDVFIDGHFAVRGLPPTARSYALTGQLAQSHQVAVQVDTEAGSQGEAPVTYVQGAPPRITPISAAAGPGLRAIRVSWIQATDDATGYDVTVKRGSTVVASKHVVDGEGADHVSFTKLPHAKLTVTVRATSGAGLGPVASATVTPWISVPTREIPAFKSLHNRWYVSGKLQWGAGEFQGVLGHRQVTLYRVSGGKHFVLARATTHSNGSFAFPSLRVPKRTTYQIRFAAAHIGGVPYAASSYTRALP